MEWIIAAAIAVIAIIVIGKERKARLDAERYAENLAKKLRDAESRLDRQLKTIEQAQKPR